MGDPRFSACVAQRFWATVDVRAPDQCWIWTGGTARGGYGFFHVIPGEVRMNAHRWAYQYANGVIPRHIRIDHRFRCSVRCCNPRHLREATQKQNQENRGGAQSDSRSGVRGVYWHKDAQRYYAQVRHHQRKIHVGAFATIAEAEAAVVAKRLELFTHNEIDQVTPRAVS